MVYMHMRIERPFSEHVESSTKDLSVSMRFPLCLNHHQLSHQSRHGFGVYQRPNPGVGRTRQ